MGYYLSVSNITKSYNIHQVLNGVSFVLNAGERIGLVGANGVGKTTLLKIITGAVEPDGGAVILPADMRLGYLEQVVHAEAGKTLDQLIADSLARLHEFEARLRTLEAQMSALAGDALDVVMGEYGAALEQFERYGGYDMDYRVDAVLDGLGVGDINRDRLFATLSGGEKARVALGLLLLQSPDVLLLDEPTNHLDIHSLTWLEDYLRGYGGAVLIVSHDRQFLNRTVNAIVEIDENARTAKRYTGDYDAYLVAKTEERRKWREDYAKQQEEIRDLRLQVKETARRNNYRTHTDADKFVVNGKKATHDNTVSKRVRVAEEKLKRIMDNLIPQPPDDLRFYADFDPKLLKGRTPLFISGVMKSFGERVVLDDVSFTLPMQGRVLLAGPNGAGKSTLLKILAGLEPADSGEVYVSPGVRVGYLAQENDDLDPTLTLFEAYAQGIDLPEQHLKASLLQSGLFRYAELGKLAGDLSSGQQRKLLIARLIAQRANLLLLDEPTNHVSFDVLESLEAALRDFPSPIIAASHDRRFIQQFGGEVWLLQDGYLNQQLAVFSDTTI